MDLKMKSNWNELKGKLKEKYGELTDDDLMYVDGKEDQLRFKYFGRKEEKQTDWSQRGWEVIRQT